MGCKRDNSIEASELDIGTGTRDVMTIPQNACEGQMQFINKGATNIFIGVCGKKATLKSYYAFLAAGKSFCEDGVIVGAVTAISDAAGGVLSASASFSLSK